ncbi:ankyrin repeat domain-containing protein [Streptosporangium sp. NBC_01755]|uniref:ankyrin repeat domain-containing protein n=1 Tax=unclassified Streptosporangium TaxID=2632669 RepID=UPI002DDA7B6F|nr:MULTISPECIES: ankyrin repeat domain-containing protein [unclassified Streptosporangium]WSA26039.1 ankyrin repeat domain-containing protein [Streptosporangium sp. NBC_01810]WSD02539.1 ankyrin repeat domain-containing protein [Streptosporangium sp. NBC_01755]
MDRRGFLLAGLAVALTGCGPSGMKGFAVLNEQLLTAAAQGDVAKVREAIANGADIEARDPQRRTALLLAAAADHVEVARVLVAAGADPNALDFQHDTPWLVTGVTGGVAMLHALLPAKPDLTIRNRYGGVSLIPACERGHVDYVREVLKTGINVNHVNDLGWTGLLEAVILGDGSAPYQEIVGLLIAGGADVNLADKEGTTPLQHALDSGQSEIAVILRAAGAR